MEVYIERSKETKNFDFNGTVDELLAKLDILSETVLVAREGTIITEDEQVNNDDQIKILSVISGG